MGIGFSRPFKALGFLSAWLLLLSANGEDAMAAGDYVLHPGSLFYKEKTALSGIYAGVWRQAANGTMVSRLKYNLAERNGVKTTTRLCSGKDKSVIGDIIASLSAEGLTLTYKLKITPEIGFGEIGFFIPSDFIFGADGLVAVSVDGAKAREIGLTPSQHQILTQKKDGELALNGGKRLLISVQGLSFTGSHGAYLQDFRNADHKGFRYVISFDTSKGCDINLILRIGVNSLPASSEMIVAPIAMKPAKASPSVKTAVNPNPLEVKFTRPALFVANGEDIDIDMDCHDKKAMEDRDYIVSWKIVNESGEEMRKDEFSAKFAKEFMHNFRFDIRRNGCYRLEVSIKNGESESRGETIFSVFPPRREPADASRDGMLGATGIGGGEGMMKLADICGVKWHRRHCGYSDTRFIRVIKDDGSLDTEYLNVGKEREKLFGLRALGSFLLCGNAGKKFDLSWEKDFDKYMDAWLNTYVIPLVKATKDHIRHWEVGNEPYYEFRQHPEVYVEILRRTSEAVKKIDPGIKIVGVCGPPNCIGDKWYKDTFKLGALKYMDILSFHQYCFTNKLISAPERGFFAWFARIRELIKEHGGGEMEIWNGETSLTPPSTMYTLPENLKRALYLNGQTSPEGREQAAVMVRLLTAHYAAGVKYIFHLFGASPEYTCHPAEFDSSPIPLAVSMAASNRFMEDARPLGEIVLGKRLKAYAFDAGSRGKNVVFWLDKLYPDDKARLSFPAELSANAAYDIFANKTGENVKELTVMPEPIFIAFKSSLTPDEFLKALSSSNVSIKESSAATAGGGAEKATPSDWVGFYPVNLAPYVNRSFTDENGGDQKGGFTDEGDNDLRMLVGCDYVFDAVPFRVIDPAENHDKSCVVLGGRIREYFPSEVKGIQIGKDGKGERLSILHFFHLVTNAYLARGKPVFEYVIHYDDGTAETVEVKDGHNVADWYSRNDLKAARRAIKLANRHTDEVSVFHHQWFSSHPKGAQARIVSIDIRGKGTGAIPVIIAITGVYSN